MEKNELNNPKDIIELFKQFAGERQEHIVVLTLGTNRSMLNTHVVAKGTMDNVQAHLRDVFFPVINDNAKSFIVMHNHPSGDTAFSKDDLNTCTRIEEAGKILGLPMMDYIVITNTVKSGKQSVEYRSLTEERHKQKIEGHRN